MEESFRWILIKITAERSRHSALDNSAVKLLGYAGLALLFCTSYTELRLNRCWFSRGARFSVVGFSSGSLLARSSQRFIRQIDLDDLRRASFILESQRQDAILKLGLRVILNCYRQAIARWNLP